MERKYRLWDKEKQRFITPVIMDVEEIDITLDMLGNVLYRFPYESGYATGIGNELFDIQFSTGLKDLHGTEIYEGDIVRVVSFEHNDSYVGRAIYSEGAYCLEVLVRGRHFKVPISTTLYDNAKFEHVLIVLGNIHENPELLKELEE